MIGDCLIGCREEDDFIDVGLIMKYLMAMGKCTLVLRNQSNVKNQFNL